MKIRFYMLKSFSFHDHWDENYFHDIVLLISQKLQHLSKYYFKGSFLLSLSSNRKFKVNLWTFCFLSYKKYICPLKTYSCLLLLPTNHQETGMYVNIHQPIDISFVSNKETALVGMDGQMVSITSYRFNRTKKFPNSTLLQTAIKIKCISQDLFISFPTNPSQDFICKALLQTVLISFALHLGLPYSFQHWLAKFGLCCGNWKV